MSKKDIADSFDALSVEDMEEIDVDEIDPEESERFGEHFADIIARQGGSTPDDE